MRTRNPGIPLVIGALFLIAACDEPNRSPTAPTALAAPVAPAPPPAAAEPASTHSLTFTASDSCLLPPDAMRRVYQVTIEGEQALTVRVKGYQMVTWGGTPGFTGTRDGATVTFQITDNPDGFGFAERIPSVGDLSFSGTATGTFTGPNINATFSGALSIDPWFLVAGHQSTCKADDHRMVFLRIGDQ